MLQSTHVSPSPASGAHADVDIVPLQVLKVLIT